MLLLKPKLKSRLVLHNVEPVNYRKRIDIHDNKAFGLNISRLY